MKSSPLIVSLALLSASIAFQDLARAKDISIKELNHANADVPFNKIMPASKAPNEYVYYDVAYRKQGCFITCDQTYGVLVKWSSFFLQVQPYERNCPLWCRSWYPAPPNKINVYTDESRYSLESSEKGDYTYYMPLKVRDAIQKSTSLKLEIPGVGLSTYKPKPESIVDIKEVVNTSVELVDYSADEESGESSSMADKLTEAESLLKSGRISPQEFKKIRANILGLSE